MSDKWTALMVGPNNGLVSKFGDQYVGHPEHYARVNMVRAEDYERLRAEVERLQLQNGRVVDGNDRLTEERDALRAEVERLKQERHKSISTLPDCMMPDGGDPCVGYHQIYNEAVRMAETLHRIGEITLAPGNWRVKDQVALNGMVAAVRDMDQALNVVAQIAKQMQSIADKREDDWDMRGLALALRGTIMDMGHLSDES